MTKFEKIFCCLIPLCICLFLGIGYAQITKELEITGLISASIPNTVYIVSVNEKEVTNVTINSETHTSTLVTSSLDFAASSSITYEITFYNGSDLIYQYIGDERTTYSNNNVTYTYTGIEKNQDIDPKTFYTMELTFSSNSAATLNSTLYFEFIVKNTEDNVGISNHQSLIEAMLDNVENGLNNPNSYLSRQIKSRSSGGFLVPSRDTLGSMAVTQGNTLEEMFGDSYAIAEEIAFLLQFVDTNNDDVIDYYYLFTTSVNLGENGSPNIARNEYIYQVYRTKIVYDSQEAAWVNEEIVEGYAKSAYYEESRYDINRTKIPSLEPDSWVSGKIGNSFSDAAWTTVNQTSLICCSADSGTDVRYYRVTVPANSSYTLLIDGDNETDASEVLLSIYDSSQNLIDSNYESIILPTSSSNVTYYITMVGSTTMDFKFVAN